MVPTLRDRVPGSSPLSRGILLCKIAGEHLEGIIPALAGNTVLVLVAGAGVSDHPRSRGEYGSSTHLRVCGEGSSPLSRGILHEHRKLRGGDGIIPALAGNTLKSLRYVMPVQDHPRSRGEYIMGRSDSVTLKGSSPLSRGILQEP